MKEEVKELEGQMRLCMEAVQSYESDTSLRVNALWADYYRKQIAGYKAKIKELIYGLH